MASKMDRLRVEHATALVKERTARIELRARWLQLWVAAVGLTTALITALGALLICIRL